MHAIDRMESIFACLVHMFDHAVNNCQFVFLLIFYQIMAIEHVIHYFFHSFYSEVVIRIESHVDVRFLKMGKPSNDHLTFSPFLITLFIIISLSRTANAM